MVQVGPRPMILCGPSGSGKSTLIKKLFEDLPDTFALSVSHTTRKPRPGEVHGQHYYFTDSQTIAESISKGEFLESATFSGNTYGTSLKAVEDVQKSGKICILDIDVQGLEQIRRNHATLDPLTIFLKPPTLDVLEQRLRNRKTETEESLRLRLDTAKREMEFGEKPGNFHYAITNDTLENVYREFRSILDKEYHLKANN